jgi:hypothetical protein
MVSKINFSSGASFPPGHRGRRGFAAIPQFTQLSTGLSTGPESVSVEKSLISPMLGGRTHSAGRGNTGKLFFKL